MITPRIVKYTALRAESLSDVISCVADFIKDGWQPYGSLAVVYNATSGYTTYIQPMVKYVVDPV